MLCLVELGDVKRGYVLGVIGLILKDLSVDVEIYLRRVFVGVAKSLSDRLLCYPSALRALLCSLLNLVSTDSNLSHSCFHFRFTSIGKLR